MIRIQLAIPHNTFVSPFTFNRLFTMHGTTMVFLVGMPILFGFGNYLVPLMIGARDMAFPRLNAFSFWISAFGGLLLYYSFIGGVGLAGTGSAPDVAWFAYAPLTEKAFSPGHTVDYWAVAIIISGIGSIGTAINILATVFCMRCKGMTLMRIPLLPWIYATTAFLVLLALGPLTACAGHAPYRSLSRRPLLRYPGRRLRHPLGSLLLDLRPPRGLCPRPARLRLRQRDHSRLLAQGHLRLRCHGRRVRRHRLHLASASGPITCSPSA